MRTVIAYLLWILIATVPLHGGAMLFLSSGGDVAAVTASSPASQAPHDPAAVDNCECSHHVKCCGGSAPQNYPSLIAPTFFSNSAVPSIEPAMTKHIPALPERPPRHFS
jgi:hypothetical protein